MKDVDPSKYNIAIITALPKEFAAVEVMLDQREDVVIPGDPVRYTLGIIHPHPVVITLLPKMGTNPASAVTSNLIRSFSNIRDILMVGIAGGVPNPDNLECHTRLGDIVVSKDSGVIQFDIGKQEQRENPKGEFRPHFTIRASDPPPSSRLLQAVSILEARRIRGDKPWEKNIKLTLSLENSRRPDDSTDILHDSLDISHIIPHPYDPTRHQNKPKVHYGLIGSSNTLLKDPQLRDLLRDEYKVRAVEMEGAGIATATWLSEMAGYLLIRGICDYCDSYKNDEWQGYAAAIAAAYARALIESIPLPNKDQSGDSFEDSLSNIESSNADSYLIHALEEHKEYGYQQVQPISSKRAGGSIFPLVIRTKSAEWDHKKIPNLQIIGQIHNIYSCIGTAQSLIAILNDSEVLSVEASRPGATSESSNVHIPITIQQRQDSLEKGNLSLVAIIDSGINIFHKSLRDRAGKTRILGIWDQTDSTGSPPKGMNFGTFHSRSEIDAYISTGKLPDNLINHENTHGTAIASIIAGTPFGEYMGGVSPESNLLLVIPNIGNRGNFNLGYSVSHLSALGFIREFSIDNQLPVVINVSMGLNSGPHDGSSILEAAFDAISDNGKYPGLVIVKSAGNERSTGRHAKLLLASNQQEELHWSSSSTVDRYEIELWFTASDKFEFKLMNPNGDLSQTVDFNHPNIQGKFASGEIYYLTYTRFHKDNGDSQLLISIFAEQSKKILAGKWALIIESLVTYSGKIDAWLESIPHLDVRFENHISEETTLNIPATARTVIAVGAVQSTNPNHLSAFSGFGPTRDGREKPDICALGENITVASSNSIDDFISMSGGSIAAAYVSGAIAQLYSSLMRSRTRDELPNALQLRQLLVQTSSSYTGIWHRGFGFGVLNLSNVLNDSAENIE